MKHSEGRGEPPLLSRAATCAAYAFTSWALIEANPVRPKNATAPTPVVCPSASSPSWRR